LLQGVVAEVSSVLGRLHEAVREFHTHGLFLYTWGDANNDYAAYMAQKEAGIGARAACVWAVACKGTLLWLCLRLRVGVLEICAWARKGLLSLLLS
jgi:hypothetical protein